MVLCHCVGVTEAEVVRLVVGGARDVAEVTRRCGAGRCCEPCREEIVDLIDRLRTDPVGVQMDADRGSEA